MTLIQTGGSGSKDASTPLPQFVHTLVWLLTVLTLVATLLIPSAVVNRDIQRWFERFELLVFVGNTTLFLVAVWQTSWRYQLACGTLIAAQVLIIGTIIGHVAGYTPASSVPTPPLLLYILIYFCTNFSLTLLFPIFQWRWGEIVRMVSDVLLAMSVTDVVLQIALPHVMGTIGVTATVSACAFRLVTSVGLSVWCVQVYRRYGAWRGVPIRLIAFGFLGLLCADALLLAATVLAEQGASALLLMVTVPGTMLHQTAWAFALWEGRRQPEMWRSEVPTPVYTTGFLAGVLSLRQIVVLIGLAVTMALSPSWRATVWFVCLLLLREALWGRQLGRTMQQLHQAEVNVRQSRDQLEGFVRKVLHDLRVPTQFLHTVRDVLEDGSLRQMLQIQTRQIHRLTSSLQHYLVWQQLPVARTSVDVVRVAIETVALFQDEAEERDVTLRLSEAERSTVAFADELAVRRILDNLISNALRATNPGGVVVVTVRQPLDGQAVVLAVRDTGRGIPAAQLARIFRPDVSSFAGGTGLGLTIVRDLCQALDAQCRVVSEEGLGSTFTILLPPWPAANTPSGNEGARP